MKKSAIIVLFLVLALIFLISTFGFASDSPVFHIPRVEGITVDGSDDDWTEQGFRVEFLTDPDGRVSLPMILMSNSDWDGTRRDCSSWLWFGMIFLWSINTCLVSGGVTALSFSSQRKWVRTTDILWLSLQGQTRCIKPFAAVRMTGVQKIRENQRLPRIRPAGCSRVVMLSKSCSHGKILG